jgi:hypothetical protein
MSAAAFQGIKGGQIQVCTVRRGGRRANPNDTGRPDRRGDVDVE